MFSKITASLFVVLFFSGCVVGRRTVDLDVPSPPLAASNGMSVAIEAVEDTRVFMDKPSSPSTPSIDGQVSRMSKREQSMMLGRQRNTYGKAMGDVALPEGQSIEEKTQLLLENGLRARGYSVGSSQEADFQVTVSVEEFWAWFTPGFVTISFEARIQCFIEIVGDSRTEKMEVIGYGMNKGQVASDANWKLAYTRAFEDFLANFAEALEERGL